MSKNLWELRKQRKMTVKQLAAKSGVPAKDIYAYESGEPIKIADLTRLARVLYVDKSEIKIKSDPVPKTKAEPPEPPKLPKPPANREPLPVPEAEASQPTQTSPKTKPQPGRKAPPSPQPATEGQLNHLRGLIEKMLLTETAAAAEIGKPLTELTFLEARAWLKEFDQKMKEKNKINASLRPPDTRRSRTSVPESVDEFEMNYLLARQEAGDGVSFTLLDGQSFTGKIIGFSPYSITFKQADGTETTIQKLALAYYHVAPDRQREEA